MNKDRHFSEEQLNAFVDDELDPEERSRLYNESSRQLELDQRLCQQRKLKELVRHAYEDIPAAREGASLPPGRRQLLGRSLVAGVLVLLGVAVGFGSHDFVSRSVAGNPAEVSVQAAAEPENHLLHIISNDPEQMNAALDYAWLLLDSAGDSEVGRVEIVANEKGLDLLRSDVTPFAEEIARLQNHNVVFYACSRTIERLRENGVDVQLVPDTRQEYTALDRVVMRMQQGWKYQKI